MAYTTIDDPSAHFQTKTGVGASSPQSHTFDGNSDLQPDLLWWKRRDASGNHTLHDSTRGGNKFLYANETTNEQTDGNLISSFDTDGWSTKSSWFDLGSQTWVAWAWKANGGTTASNSVGNITSTAQANTDAGFSIVTYTGNFTATQTVGHGLGVRPDVVIIKNRSSANDWVVWTSELTSGNFLKLNDTAAQSSSSRIYQNGYTTSTFGIGANNTVNKNSNNYVAYCFNNVQGYSKFGSYVGNGNDNGPFIYTGFKPAFVVTKGTHASQWRLYDSARSPNNVNINRLFPYTSIAEQTDTDAGIDMLSNGFKIRGSGGDYNASGQAYIYMAFADNPFVTSTGIPTTAR